MMVYLLHSKSLHNVLFLSQLDRRASLDRLRQASIVSSNSDLANSISPPAVRFTADTAAVSTNPFGLVPATRRTSNLKKYIYTKIRIF